MKRAAIFVWALMVAMPVLAQTPDTPPAETKPVDPAVVQRELATQMGGPAAQAAEAAARAEKMFLADPARSATVLRGWLKALSDAGHHDLIEKFALNVILATPGDLPTVEACQAARVRAALGLNKPDLALSHAKGLFNVSSMTTTSASLLLLAECLNAKSPGEVEPVKKFRIEQINGARTENLTITTQPAGTGAVSGLPVATTQSAANSPTLQGIKIDGAAYEEAFKKLIGEDYASLTARGNLMLLADRVKDAREMFERAYGVGADTNVVAATENLARVLKAEDGTIGRANAWVISLRPGGASVAKPAKTPRN